MAKKSSEFMPIFMVVPGSAVAAATHPSEPGKRDPALKMLTQRGESYIRVGTMYRAADESWLISIAAVPRAGQLIARAPAKGETPELR